MPELKPCPFCGGDGGVSININSKIVFGSCYDCGARGFAVKYEGRLTDTVLAEAFEAWNRRADT